MPLDLSRTRLAVTAITVVIVLAAYIAFQLTSAPGPATSSVPSSFSVNGRNYVFTYIATNQAQREAGLMNKHVTNTTTMLFAFPYFDRWTFWMYDTNTSLDMIWLNATGNSVRVVYLVTAAQPCYSNPSDYCTKYTPTLEANYVIEAKAGFAAANGILVGTSIQFG